MHTLTKLANQLDQKGLYDEANAIDLTLTKLAKTSQNVQNYIDDLKASLNKIDVEDELRSYIYQVMDELARVGNYVSPMPTSSYQPDELTVLVEGALELERSMKDIDEALKETVDESTRQDLTKLLEGEQTSYQKLLKRARGERKDDTGRFEQFTKLLEQKRKEKGWA